MSKNKYIWFDLETGGVSPSQSSVLSISAKTDKSQFNWFNKPIPGTFLSDFSKEKIIPQLQNKSLLTEEESINRFLKLLESNPEHGLAGFNIKEFDINFLAHRADKYGLGERYKKATAGRKILDPAEQIKGTVAEAISHHANQGLWKEELGASSWYDVEKKWKDVDFKERPPLYNLIAQAKGFDEDQGKKLKGWKLEDIFNLLGEKLESGAAHEGAADIAMTERVVEATNSGKLSDTFRNPEVARKWAEIYTNKQKFSSTGTVLNKQIIEDFKLKGNLSSILNNKKLLIGGGVVLGGIGLTSLFSGQKDKYNTIEGLKHGGLAQEKRLELTEFGSGWKGPKILKSSNLQKSKVQSNVLPGLSHGGLSEVIRHSMTPFGSPWDALKNLMKGNETMSTLREAADFKEALQSAKQIRSLGAGSSGEAFHMRTTFRGQELDFVRKRGIIQHGELESMLRFEDKFAPNVYSSTGSGLDQSLDMEMFKGETLSHIDTTQKMWSKVRGHMQEIHEAGYVHGDLYARNIMRTKEGNIGIIDWGNAGKRDTDAAVLTPGGGTGYARPDYDESAVVWDRTPDVDVKALNYSLKQKGHSLPVSPVSKADSPRAKKRRQMQEQSTSDAIKTSWGRGKKGGRLSRE